MPSCATSSAAARSSIRIFPDKPVTQKAGRDPHGLGQGRGGPLGGRGPAGHDALRDRRCHRGAGARGVSPGWPQAAGGDPVRERETSSRSTGGEALDERDGDPGHARRRAGGGDGGCATRRCSTCAFSRPRASLSDTSRMRQVRREMARLEDRARASERSWAAYEALRLRRRSDDAATQTDGHGGERQDGQDGRGARRALKAHPLYRKVVRRGKRYKAHDEANEARVGDVVDHRGVPAGLRADTSAGRIVDGCSRGGAA